MTEVFTNLKPMWILVAENNKGQKLKNNAG
jgi:hypothetical protein